MLKRLLLAALIALSGLSAAKAQVLQSGNVTVGHCAYWVTSGVIGDCGGPTNGALTGVGVTLNGGTAVGILSAPTTSTGWNALNFSSTTSGNQVISTQNFGTATAGSLIFNINGTILNFGNGTGTGTSGWLSGILDQQFGTVVGSMIARGTGGWNALLPGSAGQYLQSNGTAGAPSFTATAPASGTYRAVASGTTDTATTADGTVGWNSASSSAKAETIYACNGGNISRTLSVVDEKGTAGTYAITITPSSGTIQGGASFSINNNYGSVILQCDGGSNWVPVYGANGSSNSTAPGFQVRAWNASMYVSSAGSSGTFKADQITVGTAFGATTSFATLFNYSQVINLATTGAGGMDTGTAPISGFVSIYAIFGSSGTSILATNVTTSSGTIYSGANMPPGYVYSSLVGIWPTNGSSQFLPGNVQDRTFNYQTFITIFTSTTGQASLTSQSIATAVPAAARYASGLMGAISASTACTPQVASDSLGTATQFGGAIASSGIANLTPQVDFLNLPILSSSPQTIYWATSTTTSTAYYMKIAGFGF